MTKEQAKAELEQLTARCAELKAIIEKPDITPEQRFLELIDGCTIRIYKDLYPGSVFFLKDNKILFELQNSTLWYRYKGEWEVFHRECRMSYAETQVFMKNQMEKHFKMRGVTSLKAILS